MVIPECLLSVFYISGSQETTTAKCSDVNSKLSGVLLILYSVGLLQSHIQQD